VAIHGMPHFNDLQKQSEALERLTAKPDAFNIVMLHTSLGQEYRMDEYGEQIFPPDFYQKLQAFDYVALGHWHEYQPVGMHPNAWYSGSTERFSESEVGYEKGFILLNTEDGSHSFESIPTRPWYKFHLKKCREQTVKELEEQLHSAAKNMETDGAIVSVLLDQITVEQSLEMSNLRIQTLFPGCLQLLIRRRTWNDNTVFGQIDSGAFDSLDKLFSAYISEKYKDNKELSAQLRKRADQYFQRFS
jgi:exonuclease SbcD